MQIIKPYFVIEDKIDGPAILRKIEKCARTCYKSEDKSTDLETTKRFLQGVIKSGHESVIEHTSITVRIITDRGVTHELVRHRIASYSQESTRYCNYGTGRRGMTFIKPNFWDESSIQYAMWKGLIGDCEHIYNELLKQGATPQEARSILPNSLKTEIVMTANLREWRHFFKLRCSTFAHPQMRQVACGMLDEFKKLIPIIFDDITYENDPQEKSEARQKDDEQGRD